MKTKAWLKAFRLRTLPLAFSVIVAGTIMAWPHYQTNDLGDFFKLVTYKPYVSHLFRIKYDVLALTLITTLFLQILSNLANDYGDYARGTDNKDRVGPERALQSGVITKKEMFTAIVVFVFLCLISGTALLYLAFGPEKFRSIVLFFIIGILCIAAAIKYTMGKGAYGYKALGDVAVFIFFGGVGVIGSYYLQRGAQETSISRIDPFGAFPNETSSAFVPIGVILVSIAYGFWCTAVLNLNNMRDVDNDLVHHKYTMAHYLGFKGAKIYQTLLVLVPYILVYWVAQMYLGPVKALFCLIPLPLSLVQVIKIIKVTERKQFDPFLKFQALITFLNSLVLFIGLSLLHA